MNEKCLFSPVVSTQGEEMNTVKDKQISDDHSGTSEDDEQKLRVSKTHQYLALIQFATYSCAKNTVVFAG